MLLGLGVPSSELDNDWKCSWKGVKCTALGKLKRLEYHKEDLSGTLSTKIGIFTTLESIDLSNNDIDGTLPTELGLLDNRLKYFDIWDNDFSGTIPTEIGAMDDLEELYLGINELSGTIPTELGSLDDLKYLYLNENDLTGTVPLELGDMNKLKELDLSENDLTGSVVHLCGIQYLNYDMNELLGLGEFCEVSTCFQFWLNILALFGIDEIAINIGGDNDGGSDGD